MRPTRKTNFEMDFESKKIQFKEIFKIEWDKNPSLYLEYLQTLYLAEVYETTSKSLHEISLKQGQTIDLVQHISRELNKR